MRRVRSPGEKKVDEHEHSTYTINVHHSCIEHQAPSLLNTPVETTSVLTVVGTELENQQSNWMCKILQNCLRWCAEEQDDVRTAIGGINMVLEIETSRVTHPCCQSVQHDGKSEDHMIPPRPQGWLWYLHMM